MFASRAMKTGVSVLALCVCAATASGQSADDNSGSGLRIGATATPPAVGSASDDPQNSDRMASQTTAGPAASGDDLAGDTGNEIVVTGQRASLQASRNIKRNADQVVDAIVADDIGKFPDNSVAAALQRVPGVQVSNGFNNEIQGVIVRGLGDILTTLDGREIFTGVGRGFAFQDLPAEAIAGVDTYKSNSADLIEGGVAGVINMKLQKPFNFKHGLTVAANLRGFRGDVSDRTSYTAGLLASGRWDTGIGEMGLLADVSYSRNNFSRPISYNCDPRSADNGPPGAPGIALPTCVGGLVEFGYNTRPQVNAAFQWRPTADLEVYADGLYTGYRGHYGTNVIFSDIFAAGSITDAEATDTCFTAPVNAGGFAGGPTDPQQNLCLGSRATFNNVPGQTSMQAHDAFTDQYVAGGGFRYNQGPIHANLDLSYIKSTNGGRNITVDIGKTIPSVTTVINDGGHGTVTMPGNPLNDPLGFRFSNSLFQDITLSDSEQYAAKFDTTFDIESRLLRQVQMGVRYSDRKAEFRGNAVGGPSAPGGNRATLVDSVGLPSDFLIQAPRTIPYINGGATWYVPNPEVIRDNLGQLRQVYGAAPEDPPYDPVRNFDAKERTLSYYVQGKYQVDLGDASQLDGLVGVRISKLSRSLQGTGQVFLPTGTVLVPAIRDTDDTYVLPNASMRFKAGDNLQFRATYAEVLGRPAFGDLNPGLSLDAPNGNPNVVLAGSGGNPDLKAQISNSYDLTAEFYFGKSSYVSIAGYYRDIKDRAAPNTTLQLVNGSTYRITQPRNIAKSELKGIEVSTQTFFDFLPEGLDGLGVMANFTYADSEVKSPGDPLEGKPLLGVSKYSYNIGGLYEKYGVTARVVYNWRDKYNEFLFGGGVLVSSDFSSQFNSVKANGRLDFSVSYDVTKNVTVSVDGVNVLGGKYYSYFNTSVFPHDVRVDDRFYGASVRTRF